MTSTHDLIREGIRRAYRARPRAPLADAVGGQAGGSGDGWAVEAKTAPMQYAVVTAFGEVAPSYVAIGRQRRPPTPPDAVDTRLIVTVRR